MSKVNRETLRTFLVDNAKETHLIAETMEYVSPFFSFAERRNYPFAVADCVDVITVAKIVSAVIDQPVTRVVPILLKKPCQEWKAAEEAANRDGMYDHCCDTLWGNLRCEFGLAYEEILGDRVTMELEWILEQGLRETGYTLGFGNELFLQKGVEQELKELSVMNLVESLTCFLCAAIVGDEKVVHRLTPFIKLLPSTVPLHAKYDEPESWFALVS